MKSLNTYIFKHLSSFFKPLNFYTFKVVIFFVVIIAAFGLSNATSASIKTLAPTRLGLVDEWKFDENAGIYPVKFCKF